MKPSVTLAETTLSGGATLATGSWVFMMAVFAGGYAFAYVVRRQWI